MHMFEILNNMNKTEKSDNFKKEQSKMTDKKENFKYNRAVYCLPSTSPFKPYMGSIPNKDNIMIPMDIPSTLTDSMCEAYSVNPEQVLMKFLEANPNFYNPRDIARIIFHSPNVSPYANALILFNSSFSSRSLLLSFITAIDLDCIGLIDAISYITSKVAFPENAMAITMFAEIFAHIYCMRNPLEWPDKAVVRDIFFSVIASQFFKEEFSASIENYPTLKTVSKYVLDQISYEVRVHPPPIYFTCCPLNAPQDISDLIEHEGRYMSSWNTYYYRKEGNIIRSYKDAKSTEVQAVIPLDFATAAPKTGVKNKQNVLVITRVDNLEFGEKLKDGVMKKSPRTSYTVAFKTEKDLFTWISSINNQILSDTLKQLYNKVDS